MSKLQAEMKRFTRAEMSLLQGVGVALQGVSAGVRQQPIFVPLILRVCEHPGRRPWRPGLLSPWLQQALLHGGEPHPSPGQAAKGTLEEMGFRHMGKAFLLLFTEALFGCPCVFKGML